METIAKYKCGQDELYGVCDLIIKSLEENLVSFTGFKPKYVAAFVADLRLKLEQATLLPGDDQRLSSQELLREAMVEKLRACLENLNMLKLYIRDAYSSANVRELKLKEAGFGDYTEAASNNWEKLRAIMMNANLFIAANEADLLANDNMLPTFKASFAALESGVQGQITEMLNKRENNRQATSEKLRFNNVIFDDIMGVCEDGSFLFRNDAALKAQFIFSSVLELVTPHGAAGLKGEVRAAVTNVLLANVMVVLLPEGLPEIVEYTDENGKYEFKNLPAETYLCKVDKEGYETLNVNVSIETGITSTKNFSLVAVV